METHKLKAFAQSARRQLLEQVAVRLEQVLRADSIETREKKAAISELRNQIAQSGKPAVIDRAAYTWFNRFCALRFMDANHYTRIGIVSPVEGYTQPEILQEAKQGVIEGELKVDRQHVLDILSGRLPSTDPQGEAYRLLLVGACNTYHQQMPFLFEPIADYTELLLPDDLLSESSVLHQLRRALDEETCQDVEAIGWLYQFYISERKDQVFANLKQNIKIEARDIPAATQLFTPHWIVRYLVENSLGRLWMLNHPDSKLVAQMDYYIQPEQEETDFLKVESPEEIKMCDPACGSGHMLTYAFDLLYAIYAEQGYDPAGIPSLILQKNLYGIEIDKRAGDLAAFALVMKARAKDRRFFSRSVEPNICVLQNVEFTASEIKEYMQVVGNDLFTQDLWETLKQFEQADNFGSLIRPQLKDVAAVRSRLEEKKVFENLFLHNTNQKVQLLLNQTEYLSLRYHVVSTNPPYMGSGGMNEQLKDFVVDYYPDSKSNLFSVFIERSLTLLRKFGMLGIITMESWMFLTSFYELRKTIIGRNCIISMIHLGPHGFDTIGGEIVSTTAFILKHLSRIKHSSIFIRLVDGASESEKEKIFRNSILIIKSGVYQAPSYRLSQLDFLEIPTSPLAYWLKGAYLFKEKKLSDAFISGGRNKTHDNEKYVRYFWEISVNNTNWNLYANGGHFRKYYGNDNFVVDWSQKARENYESHGGLLNSKFWGKEGITWSLVSSDTPAFRVKIPDILYSSGSPTIFNHNYSCDKQVLAYLNSPIARHFINTLNPTINTTVNLVLAIPYRHPKNKEVIDRNINRLINIHRYDWDSQETSIGFKTCHLIGVKPLNNRIIESYTILRKQRSNDTEEALRLEEENNSFLLATYDLENELDPRTSIDEITLYANPYHRYKGNKNSRELENSLLTDTMKEFISYAVGCMFGRYSLDKPGLILASQGETARDYSRQVPQPSFPPDEDNVIPLLEAGWFSDDISERFKRFLKVSFGEEHFEENLSFIENAIGRDIRGYFLKDFYSEHLKMYKSHPIYWLFSSPSGSFNALIYMHRYRPDTVSVILNDYLRQYIRKLQAHKAHLEQVGLRMGGSPAEKAKATKEINALNKILAELKEYEDEVLYPLATRQVQIDLDDGVKVNYKKFGKALKSVKGLSE